MEHRHFTGLESLGEDNQRRAMLLMAFVIMAEAIECCRDGDMEGMQERLASVHIMTGWDGENFTAISEEVAREIEWMKGWVSLFAAAGADQGLAAASGAIANAEEFLRVLRENE